MLQRILIGLISWSLASAATAGNAAGPRPISPLEREALRLAVLYLELGADAWWDELSADAPLRELGRQDAVDEIAVRCGPPQDATWTLTASTQSESTAVFSIEFPSGIDEILALDFATQDGGKLRAVRSLVDQRPPRRESAAPPAPRVQEPSLPPLLGMALFLSLAGVALARSRRAIRRPVYGLAVLWVAVLASCQTQAPDPNPSEATLQPAAGPETLTRLASLHPLRQRLARGTSTADLDLPSGRPGGVAWLWIAQHHLVRRQLSEAESALEMARTSLDDVPLMPLVEARLGVLQSKSKAALAAYRRAFETIPEHDGIRLEAALGLGRVGMLQQADESLGVARRFGSRQAEVYYRLARLDLVHGKPESARQNFNVAWDLRPLERSRIFADTALAHVAVDPEVLPLLQVSLPSEPVSERPPAGSPLDVLARFSSRILGQELTVDVESGRLVVPGGALLAPLSALPDDAGAAARRREARALEALGEADGIDRSISPEQLETASVALSRSHRWDEVVRITDQFGDRPELVSPELGQLRARALFEAERSAEARKLLIRIAQNDIDNERRDPSTFLQLSELMAASGHYDLAIRLIRRADELLPFNIGGARIRQLEMEKRLEESFKTFKTRHFDIRYPASTGILYARDIGLVLEEERRRLAKWIPVSSDVRIGIDLFPIRKFMQAYSQGILVLGLYDGRVRLPFAELKSLHPELVKVLSHEVAHAMIAEYTGNRSPKWLHEGLAQHVEMGQSEANPIPDMDRLGRVLSFPLIEAVLRGFGESQLVGLAYRESAWLLHFVEARYGVRGIHRLLDAYRSGDDTPAAIRRAFGKSPEELEEAAWKWCLDEAPMVWPTEVRRYDREIDSTVRKSTRMPAATEVDEAPGAPPPMPRVRWRAPPPKVDPMIGAMAAWHARYAQRVEPIKAALVPVIQAVRATEAPAPEACHRLSGLLNVLLQEGDVFRSPDRGITGQRLRMAFQRFRRLSRACEEGHATEIHRQLTVAEENLAQAAARLERYGLKP